MVYNKRKATLKKKVLTCGKRIAIIHFNPVDKYPPAVNCIRYIAEKKSTEASLLVVSAKAEKNHWQLLVFGAKFYYAIAWIEKLSKPERVLKYFFFNIKTLFKLLFFRPDTVLYYETISAWAPYVYKKWINKSSRLFIHYHEYTSPEEYQHQMIVNRWMHKLERKIYEQCAWISHTNQDRLQMFLNDINPIRSLKVFVLPNYPPKSWKSVLNKTRENNDGRIGFVYVGALSVETMYTKEMAEFVAANPGRYYWDIYSDNHQKETLDFLHALKANNICFKGPVSYDDLPDILQLYDIGVILYKGHIPNFIFNAPNKLFEYMACGLDVWFPVQMKGVYPYASKNAIPYVLPIDFEKLDKMSFAISKKEPGLPLSCHHYYAEDVLLNLWNRIIEAD